MYVHRNLVCWAKTYLLTWFTIALQVFVWMSDPSHHMCKGIVGTPNCIILLSKYREQFENCCKQGNYCVCCIEKRYEWLRRTHLVFVVQVSCLFSGYFDAQILQVKQIVVAILPTANIDPRTVWVRQLLCALNWQRHWCVRSAILDDKFVEYMLFLLIFRTDKNNQRVHAPLFECHGARKKKMPKQKTTN